jgi:GNAT superfamily N-acetyltransferase
MTVRVAQSDEEIAACFPVIHELRRHIRPESFVARVRLQQESGYRLAYVPRDGRAVAVAGFRIGENLAWGRFLYVDDLVTLSEYRSSGHGRDLLSWLRDYAHSESCDELHLDSGTHRAEAHRFYRREGLEVSSFHFGVKLRR